MAGLSRFGVSHRKSSHVRDLEVNRNACEVNTIPNVSPEKQYGSVFPLDLSNYWREAAEILASQPSVSDDLELHKHKDS